MLRWDFCFSIPRASQSKVALPQETCTQTQSFFTTEKIITGWYYRSSHDSVSPLLGIHCWLSTFQRCGPVNNAAPSLFLNCEFFLFLFGKKTKNLPRPIIAQVWSCVARRVWTSSADRDHFWYPGAFWWTLFLLYFLVCSFNGAASRWTLNIEWGQFFILSYK